MSPADAASAPAGPAAVPVALPVVVLGALAGLAVLALLRASFRRVPAGRYAVVRRLGRCRAHGPGHAVIVPQLDRVVWLDDATSATVVVPCVPSEDGVTVGPVATVRLLLEDPVLAVRHTDDPVLVAQEVVEAELVRFAADRTLPELVALVQTSVPEVAARATAVTAGFGVRVACVRLERLELPRPDEVVRWGTALRRAGAGR
jgi:regulator of protease activity HflC (stomatin/prohibitin superfamily)